MAKRVVFTGGGTGGHVYPGLAIADELRDIGISDISWIGSTQGIERRICRRAGIPFLGIPAGKLRRYLSLRNLSDVFRILAGFFRALGVLRSLKPDILFSKGGYVSVPPVVAARLLGIPSVTHESDMIPGLATRINARFVERVLVPYQESVAYLDRRARKKAVVTGNPVRRSILEGRAACGRDTVGAPEGVPVLLVLGGSLGSARINAAVSDALPTLVARCFVVHQRGDHPPSRGDGERYFSRSFFYTEMPGLLAAADLVVARAGAGTIWELAATRTPAVLVPLGTAGSRGDQIENARAYAASGAARVVPDEEATGARLAEEIAALLDDYTGRQHMAAAAGRFGARDVARHIAQMVGSVPEKSRRT